MLWILRRILFLLVFDLPIESVDMPRPYVIKWLTQLPTSLIISPVVLDSPVLLDSNLSMLVHCVCLIMGMVYLSPPVFGLDGMIARTTAIAGQNVGLKIHLEDNREFSVGNCSAKQESCYESFDFQLLSRRRAFFISITGGETVSMPFPLPCLRNSCDAVIAGCWVQFGSSGRRRISNRILDK